MPATPCIVCGRTDRPVIHVAVYRGQIQMRMNDEISAGVSICAQSECVQAARENRTLEVHFNRPVSASCYTDLAKACQTEKSHAEALIGLGVKGRNIALGYTAVALEAKQGRLALLILSSDAGPTLQQRLSGLSMKYGIPLYTADMERPLSAISGKANCKCAGVRDAKLAAALQKTTDFLTGYETA